MLLLTRSRRRRDHASLAAASIACALLGISGVAVGQSSAVVAAAASGAHRGPPDASRGTSAASAAISEEELDALLAPIALYPDALLSQVLMASTYPLEIVEAERFVRHNPKLQGEALDEALATKRWDPSVQSLAGYPKVLAMMSERLEWTERLGNAVLEDESRVMDAVQSLRARAYAAGKLESTAEQKVVREKETIVIEPRQRDVVYVYDYDPAWVYGAYWSTAAAYYYGRYYGGTSYSVSVSYSSYRISANHWNGSRADWNERRLAVDGRDNRFWSQTDRAQGGAWQHDSLHRRGVDYPSDAMRQRFGEPGPNRQAGSPPGGLAGDPRAAGAGLPQRGPGAGLEPPRGGPGGPGGPMSPHAPQFPGGLSGMPSMPSMPPMPPGPPPLPGPH